MSSDQRKITNISDVPSTVKKRRMKWKDDPNSPVPRSTRLRWENIQKKSNVYDSSISDTSDPDNDIDPVNRDHCITTELDTTESDLSELSDSDVEHEGDNEEGDDNLNLSGLIAEFDDELTIQDSDDESNSMSDDDVESSSSIASEIISLYDDSDISLTRSVLLIMNIYIQNKLTKTALQALLTALQEILPKPNRMPRTVHNLLKFVENKAHSTHIIKHYYCKKCLHYNNTNAELEKCVSCSSTDGTSFFFEIDLVDQIRYMFEKRNLAEKLHVSDHQPNVISDITDGSEYIRINSRSNKGKFDLTLVLNTDGISLVKSSKSHCWPLMLMITELPEHLRERFICIIGLWYDTTHKPLMNTFLRPYCEKLIQCFQDGITWVDPVTAEICTSRNTAPLFIADAPARAEIQNIQYFTGKYGCNICEIKTKRCQKVVGRKTTRAYTFREKVSRLRCEDRMDQQAETALKYNLPHKKGVKGKSIISAIPFLKLETCVLPEYMHCTLLGVAKQFVNLWLHTKGDWYIKQFVSEIDDKLLKIYPPNFFNRKPRSVTYLPFYKASEFYNLVLFYSVPIFSEFLPDRYMQHWLLFVMAIYTLLEKHIHIDPELERADILLQLFVRDIHELYGDRQYTYNVHQLLHLVLCIKRWGPLWSTSAFPFENVNGILAKCVHGTKHLGQEMVNNLKIAQGVQTLKIMCERSVVDENSSSRQSNNYILKDNINILRSGNNTLLEIVQSLNLNIENTLFFAKAVINNYVYTSESYKNTQANSYTVEINTNDEVIYGTIVCFTKNEEKISYVVRTFDIDDSKMFCHRESNTILRHILPVNETNHIKIIEADNIKSMIHVIRVLNFICKRPNRLNKVM